MSGSQYHCPIYSLEQIPISDSYHPDQGGGEGQGGVVWMLCDSYQMSSPPIKPAEPFDPVTGTYGCCDSTTVGQEPFEHCSVATDMIWLGRPHNLSTLFDGFDRQSHKYFTGGRCPLLRGNRQQNPGQLEQYLIPDNSLSPRLVNVELNSGSSPDVRKVRLYRLKCVMPKRPIHYWYVGLELTLDTQEDPKHNFTAQNVRPNGPHIDCEIKLPKSDQVVAVLLMQ